LDCQSWEFAEQMKWFLCWANEMISCTCKWIMVYIWGIIPKIAASFRLVNYGLIYPDVCKLCLMYDIRLHCFPPQKVVIASNTTIMFQWLPYWWSCDPHCANPGSRLGVDVYRWGYIGNPFLNPIHI
jgi:hypothetical protein